jgi:hypothetical protein
MRCTAAENEVLRVCSVWRDVGHTGLDRVRIVIRPVASFQKSDRTVRFSVAITQMATKIAKLPFVPTATLD